MARKIRYLPPPDPELGTDARAQGITDLLDRLLAKAPSRRPSSAEAVVAELEALLGPAGDLPHDQAPTVTL